MRHGCRNNFVNFLYLHKNMSLFGYQISKDGPQMPLGTLASQKASILAPGTNFHANRLITYLGIPSNRCFVSFRSNKSGPSLDFVTIISLSHWFAGRYYFFL